MRRPRPEILVVASRADPASMNIAGKLLEEFGFEPLGPSLYARGDVALLITDAELIYAEGLAADLQPKAMIFASRHASTQAVPTLSTHTPGNLGPWAEHGGKPREIAWSDPRRMKAALIALRAQTASDRVIIVADAEGGSPKKVRDAVNEHVPAEHRQRTRIVVLPYCVEEWVCVGLNIPFGGGRTPVDALKDYLRKQKGAKADYQKHMLEHFADELDVDKLMKHPSFKEFVEALKP